MQSPRLFRSLALAGAIVASLILSGALSACSNSTQSLTPAGTVTNSTRNQSVVQSAELELWHRSLARNPLPGPGCFQTSYPSTAWQRVACSTPPHLLYPVSAVRRHAMEAFAQNVGNGADYTANTSPHLISTAVGAFPKVSDVTKVQSVTNPLFGCCGENGPNSYTLQLNSYFFSTSACGNIQNCAGWEQFVYENPPFGNGQLFIQDWLIPIKGNGLSGCPPGKGWEFADGGCVQNSLFGVNVPNLPIKSLGKFVETGTASSSGDSIFLAVGSTEYGMQNVQSDGITDLKAHWKGAEFNVIGNAGGDIAKFNKGAKITVSLQTDTGLTTAPKCPANSGTTGESNNLNFVAAPANPPKLQYPSIEFTMSSARGATPSCDQVQGI
jgi:hypothetical protein